MNDDDELIVAHLAGATLDDDVAEAVAGRPELAAELAAVADERGLLADPAIWADAPPLADAILAGIDAAASDDVEADRPVAGRAAGSGGRRPLDRRVRRNLRWSGAAALAAAAVVVVVMVVGGTSPTPQVQLELAGTEHAPEASGRAGVQRTDGGVRIDLQLDGLAVPGEDELYHGWVVVDQPISIGTFHLNGRSGTVVLWAGVDWDQVEAVTVTHEKVDGSTAAVTVLEVYLDED